MTILSELIFVGKKMSSSINLSCKFWECVEKAMQSWAPHANSTQEGLNWDSNPEPVICEADVRSTCILIAHGKNSRSGSSCRSYWVRLECWRGEPKEVSGGRRSPTPHPLCGGRWAPGAGTVWERLRRAGWSSEPHCSQWLHSTLYIATLRFSTPRLQLLSCTQQIPQRAVWLVLSGPLDIWTCCNVVVLCWSRHLIQLRPNRRLFVVWYLREKRDPQLSTLSKGKKCVLDRDSKLVLLNVKFLI